MFGSYEVDFSKVNLHWCNSVCIQLDEIDYLLALPEHSVCYLREGGLYEIVGYTNYHKFVAVTFAVTPEKVIIESVALPGYGSIRDVVLRQFLEESN